MALRHGLSEQTMRAWLTEQGSELAERMLREFRVELIGYQISCLGAVSAAVLLLLLSDQDKDNGTAEQINTVSFDIAYGVRDLASVDGTGLHKVIMTIIDDTNLDHEQIMDYIDQRVADLSEQESKLLQLLSSPQQQPW